jgi:hypothetical protein
MPYKLKNRHHNSELPFGRLNVVLHLHEREFTSFISSRLEVHCQSDHILCQDTYGYEAAKKASNNNLSDPGRCGSLCWVNMTATYTDIPT